MSPPTIPALKPLIDRAQRLYSLPTVALETIELTRSPDIDGRLLRDSLQRDPALVAKLLRVVNSPATGLATPVTDVGQAIALLGARSLKLLVLGFALPENLWEGLPADLLTTFWTRALVRAASARALAPTIPGAPADAAFTAGLLAELGALVMIQHLGASYAGLLRQAEQRRLEALRVERQALGFDRADLTVALLRGWNIPEELPSAVAEAYAAVGRFPQRRCVTPLGRVLHLAEQATRVIADRSLTALPELTDAAMAYGEVEPRTLRQRLGGVEQEVAALAEALRLPTIDHLDTAGLLAEGYARLAELAEQAASLLARPQSDDELCEAILSAMHDLRADATAACGPTPAVAAAVAAKLAQAKFEGASVAAPHLRSESDSLLAATQKAADRCREDRQPLSLLLLGLDSGAPDPAFGKPLDIEGALLVLRDVVVEVLGASDAASTRVLARRSPEIAALASGIDRGSATRIARRIQDRMASLGEGLLPAVKIGIASIGVPSSGFDASALMAAADRCLSAARVTGGPAVKSIEVY